MTLSTSYVLDRAFLNLASNPSSYIVAGTAGGIGGGGQRAETYTQEGNFRQYANYNIRLIQGTARTRILTPLALRALTPQQVDLLLTFVGKTVLFRDTYGRKMWGSFLAPQITDIPLSGAANGTLLTDVSITIQEITYSEVV